MSFFVRLNKPPAVPLFVSSICGGRSALEASYHSAFSSADKRNELHKFMLFAEFNIDNLWRGSGLVSSTVERERLHSQIYGEDLRANQQALVVLLAADDALQRLGRSLFGKAPGVKRGFGPAYRDVRLTSLLRATTNCARHVSEWDDDLNLIFPYENNTKPDGNVAKALESIEVLGRVHGLGKHERIYTAPCFGTLAVIDGLYGTHPVSYARFESAVLIAAREIISVGESAQPAKFENEISRYPNVCV